MDTLIIILVVIFIVSFILKSLKSKEQNSSKKYSNSYSHDRRISNDVFGDVKYELRVMPTVFTNLKTLKMRDRVFDKQADVHKLNLDPSKAYPLPFTSSTDLTRDEQVWTDGGYAHNQRQLEDYYEFLEEVRKIFENKAASAENRFQKIVSFCKQNDKHKEYFKNLNEYYKAFPACLFYEELTEIDGIGDSTAHTLFNSGIRTLKELNNASDEELNEVSGIGNKTIQQIRNYFKNKLDLSEDMPTDNLSESNETELSNTSNQSKSVEKWNDQNTQKGITPDGHSMGVRRSVIQILETTAIMSSSKNIDTILGRADFLRERFVEIIRASKTPQYSSDLQYALDEYRSTYYNTDIQGWQMKIFLQPENFDIDKFCAKCLYEGFLRHFDHQQEQISNLKRESAIKNRYKKLHEIFNRFLEEFNKEWNSNGANEFKNNKLEQLKDIKSTIISNEE